MKTKSCVQTKHFSEQSGDTVHVGALRGERARAHEDEEEETERGKGKREKRKVEQ